MKLLSVLALIGGVLLINVNSESAEFGKRERNDELIHLEIVTRKFKIINGHIYEDYVFPPPGGIDLGPLTITNIKVTDRWDNGATANLTNGGPGLGWFTMYLEAKLFKGFSYLIEIYGFKNSQLLYY